MKESKFTAECLRGLPVVFVNVIGKTRGGHHSTPGWPDRYISWSAGGRNVRCWLEFKAQGGSASDAQRRVLGALRAHDSTQAYIVRERDYGGSVEDENEIVLAVFDGTASGLIKVLLELQS